MGQVDVANISASQYISMGSDWVGGDMGLKVYNTFSLLVLCLTWSTTSVVAQRMASNRRGTTQSSARWLSARWDVSRPVKCIRLRRGHKIYLMTRVEKTYYLWEHLMMRDGIYRGSTVVLMKSATFPFLETRELKEHLHTSTGGFVLPFSIKPCSQSLCIFRQQNSNQDVMYTMFNHLRAKQLCRAFNMFLRTRCKPEMISERWDHESSLGSEVSIYVYCVSSPYHRYHTALKAFSLATFNTWVIM